MNLRTFRRLASTNDRDVFGGACHKQFFAAGRQPPYAPEGGDAGALLRDAGRRLWPCPQRPGAGAHLYKYNSGTGNWNDYTRLLNRTIAARWRAWFAQPLQRDWAFACPAPWQPWPYAPPLMAGWPAGGLTYNQIRHRL